METYLGTFLTSNLENSDSFPLFIKCYKKISLNEMVVKFFLNFVPFLFFKKGINHQLSAA